MNFRSLNLTTLLTQMICLIVNYKFTLFYFIMLVSFGISTVIMVRKMKSSGNTQMNTLIKRTSNEVMVFLKQSCNILENTLIYNINHDRFGNTFRWRLVSCGNQSIDLLWKPFDWFLHVAGFHGEVFPNGLLFIDQLSEEGIGISIYH